MAVKKLYLDKRTLKTPGAGGSEENLQNLLDIKAYVESILAGQPILVFPNGTAAAPGITFVGDTDTGIYLGGNNILDFSVAGARVLDLRTGAVQVPAGVVLRTDTITEITASAGITADSVLLKDGGVSNTGGTTFAGFYFDAAQNNITAGTGGAISVANYLTTINTDAGGDAFTLANGTQIGQMKKILLVADGGGDGVVTPATAFAGGATTATFNDATDYLILMWNGSAWRVLENSGVTVA